MKTFTITFLALSLLLFNSCSNSNTQIGENTFIHDHKIYKIIDNELREIGDLNATDIKKFEVSKPSQRDLGTKSVGQIKKGASASLKALYRGNFLYYTLRINDLNDLRENYKDGDLNIVFIDQYGFVLHSTTINAHDLIGELGSNGGVTSFFYNGKTEMSIEINSAIKDFEITSSIKPKSRYEY